MPSLLPASHIAAFISWEWATTARRAALFLFLLAGGAAAVHGQSALDGVDPNANGPIYTIAVQPDGILIGGDFTSLSVNGGAAVTRNHIARLNPDGTLDPDFNPNANSQVNSIAVQADGKILIGGRFTIIGGQTRSCIARLDATTGLPDSFDPNPNSNFETSVNSIAIQADGKILVGGYFATIGGQARKSIARLDAATGLADSFDPNANAAIYAIAVQSDGKILVGGSFSGFKSIGGTFRRHIARLEPTTGLADSFNPDADGVVFSITVQPDGKILTGGFFEGVGGQQRNHIARLNSTTGLADSFDPNANNTVWSIALQADGKILAGGIFTNIGGQVRSRIARLEPTTGLADSFNPNASEPVEAIAVQADGKILVGGNFTTLAPNGGAAVTRNHIARLETDGRLDQTLNLGIVGTDVLATAIQPDGKILIGGSFSSVLGVPRNNIARLNTDGTVDTAFDPNATDEAFPAVLSIAVQPDGKILVGGSFGTIGGQMRRSIARLDATTGLADSFDPNASVDADVAGIAVQADGKILVGGFFTNMGGQERSYIARLDRTTGLADSFDPNASDNIFSIAVQADGKILAGGFFTSIGGATRHRMARLDANTGLADSFDPNVSCTECGPPPARPAVVSIALQADGKIVTGGLFESIGGQARHSIARLDATTGLADSFDPNANEAVYSIAIQADGQVFAGGLFSGVNSIGGETRNHLARLDATTGLADSFDPNANDSVFSIAVQADGKVLAGGLVTNIGGQPRALFARLSNGTAALQDLAVTQGAITWTHGGSSPQLTRVTFESSPDKVHYTFLGHGIPQSGSSNWSLTGLNLPTGQNFYIRARGCYRSGYLNGSESITESVRRAFLAGPTQEAQPLNLSTRMRVQTGDNVGIAGFIITGTAPKHVLLRAIGPSLTQSGVPDALADPVLELHGPDPFVTITNNNWRDDPDQEVAILATGIAPPNDLEAAIDATLPPGTYTAIVRGNGDTSGVALVELYDLSHSVDAKLANVSTRAFVSTGDNIVIAGFMLGGDIGYERIGVRGLGPSLTATGVPDALADPTLELRDGNGALLGANNDWQDDPSQAAEMIAAGLAPANPFESGLAATLSPGLYTALLTGLNNGTGVGLVEVYSLGAP
ncbi:MAG TPA: delta-60 repeat domain-containing protein [Chthoniobacterales bacterium]|nr:delta-60 repeat domain-containing protein [Chthoniobacterales bacterium]